MGLKKAAFVYIVVLLSGNNLQIDLKRLYLLQGKKENCIKPQSH